MIDSKLPLKVAARSVQPVYDLVSIGDRIKAARNHLGITQADLAKLIGGSKPGIQDNEAGKNMPGGKVLLGLAKHGINTNWLLTGDGQMLLADPQKEAPPVDMARLGMVIRELEAALSRHRRLLDPERKARAVTVLYEYFTKAGPQDQAAIERVLDLMI